LLDFAIAIYVYTLSDPAVYAVINAEMFNEGRRKPGAISGISSSLRACLPFIKFLDSALAKLPESYIFQGEVRRGTKWVYSSPTKHDPKSHFPVGQMIMWYEFKSTSTEPKVMMRDNFCGVNAGPRTIFTVTATRAYDIQKFSYFQGTYSEHEVLFRPFAKFKVLHAQKNIIDPKEKVSLQKSGFPDAVALQQVCDGEEETQQQQQYAPPPPPPPGLATIGACFRKKVISAYLYIHLHICIYVCVCSCVCVCVCMHVCMYIYIYACIYIYMYVYICIYTCFACGGNIYIYIYIYIGRYVWLF
jgi:hypothetical protein